MTSPTFTVNVQGTGSVSADELNTFPQVALTSISLRGMTGKANMVVISLGGVAIADGLGAIFYWNPTSTGADNSITVIAPTGLAIGRWIAIAIIPGALPSQSVIGLPSPVPTGQLWFATNGRDAGEGPGAGTGVVVVSKLGQWYTLNGSGPVQT